MHAKDARMHHTVVCATSKELYLALSMEQSSDIYSYLMNSSIFSEMSKLPT